MKEEVMKEEVEEGEREEARDAEVVTDLEQLKVREESSGGGVLMKKSSILKQGAVSQGARETWRELNASTLPLARRLCEKLRLVMEPLVATKLQGDYRTGKRINMKKVIGFIASGFRKDKIWLRRTKPAKRNFRVLLAIDDSESMKGGGGQMALRSLAIMANAMAQLEVGEFGVATFGEDMQMVHEFGDTWTGSGGGKVVEAFKFEQQRTKLTECLQTSYVEMQEGAGDGRQIMFVVTDGRVERDSRAELRRLNRDMAAQGILVVALVVDVPGKQSLLKTKEVSFDPETGKPKVKFFIEDFPFPYYTIIQDTGKLPEVLGSSLAQWFNMMSNNER